MTDSVFSRKEKEIELKKLDNESEQQDMEIAQKKALIAEAKAKYGSGWRKVLGMAKGMAPNREVIQDLYSMGMGSNELRELSKPGSMRR